MAQVTQIEVNGYDSMISFSSSKKCQGKLIAKVADDGGSLESLLSPE